MTLCVIAAMLSGCGGAAGKSEKSVVNAELHEFFRHLDAREYGKAYGMLTSDAQKMINAASFASRYESVFNLLEIEGIDLSVSQTSEEEVTTHCAFTLTYKSARAGEIVNYYEADLFPNEDGWQIDWSPSMIFPDMDWGDRIVAATSRASRGEIYAGSEPLAVSAPGVSVCALPDKIEDKVAFSNTIAPLIGVEAEEIQKKLDAVQLQAQVTTDYVALRSIASTQGSTTHVLLNRGDTAQILDDGKIYVSEVKEEAKEEEKESLFEKIFGVHEKFSFNNPYAADMAPETIKTQSFYHVRYRTDKNSSSIDGYVFAPYVTARNYPDIIELASLQTEAVSEDTLAQIEQIRGARVDSGRFTYRSYPKGAAFFHLVGYVGGITDVQLQRFTEEGRGALYTEDSIVGQSGLESYYEKELRGEDGQLIYIANENGNNKKTLYEQKPKNGMDITLTVDATLQQRAYDLLRIYLTPGQSGAIVVNDPKTGAVKASVSYPSIDPNELMRLKGDDVVKLLNDPAEPFFNRATQGLYAPGSVFKPFTAVIGMENDVIGVNSVFPYEIVDNKWTPKSKLGETPNGIVWNYPAITRVENRGGDCDFRNAMRFSDNIFFAWTAMNIGADTFMKYCEDKLGFGEAIPYDLPVATSSVFKVNGAKDPYKEFNIKFLADSGYGQGKMLMTPLHVATVFGAFANNGDVMRPFVIESMDHVEGLRLVNDKTTKPTVWKQGVVTDAYVKSKVIESLRDVMDNGTGNKVEAPYPLAGKTGTAEKIKNVSEIAWLAAFKAGDPTDYLAVVTIECAPKEGTARYPILQLLFDYDAKTRNTRETSTAMKVVAVDQVAP